jgi:hypothetical protein
VADPTAVQVLSLPTLLSVLLAIGEVSWSVWLHPQPQRSEAIKVVETVCWTSLQATLTETGLGAR